MLPSEWKPVGSKIHGMSCPEFALDQRGLAHPETLGPDVLVVTFEFDRWSAAGGDRERDRLDVLGIGTDGRLLSPNSSAIELRCGLRGLGRLPRQGLLGRWRSQTHPAASGRARGGALLRQSVFEKRRRVCVTLRRVDQTWTG
jgi:hypothetical protein